MGDSPPPPRKIRPDRIDRKDRSVPERLATVEAACEHTREQVCDLKDRVGRVEGKLDGQTVLLNEQGRTLVQLASWTAEQDRLRAEREQERARQAAIVAEEDHRARGLAHQAKEKMLGAGMKVVETLVVVFCTVLTAWGAWAAGLLKVGGS